MRETHHLLEQSTANPAFAPLRQDKQVFEIEGRQREKTRIRLDEDHVATGFRVIIHKRQPDFDARLCAQGIFDQACLRGCIGWCEFFKICQRDDQAAKRGCVFVRQGTQIDFQRRAHACSTGSPNNVK